MALGQVDEAGGVHQQSDGRHQAQAHQSYRQADAQHGFGATHDRFILEVHGTSRFRLGSGMSARSFKDTEPQTNQGSWCAQFYDNIFV